ncbi:MAG TPA: hypothetical protein VFO85_07230, partial [Vicinamibacteria bacterium]|nr:hypothetical protein [Vicinamibacteria bacterium]
MARRLSLLLAAALSVGGCSTSADGPAADFLVEVGSETFILRSTHPATIAQLREAAAGRRAGFPLGPLRAGNGGFNAPWTWHLDPEETRLTEVAIEVCDGAPSYVEQHQGD